MQVFFRTKNNDVIKNNYLLSSTYFVLDTLLLNGRLGIFSCSHSLNKMRLRLCKKMNEILLSIS